MIVRRRLDDVGEYAWCLTWEPEAPWQKRVHVMLDDREGTFAEAEQRLRETLASLGYELGYN